MREQDGRNNSSDIKEDLRGKKDAGQMNAELHLGGREAVEHPSGELRREDFGEDCASDQDRGHYGDDDGEGFLRVRLALFGQEPRVDGDEGDGGGASGDDVVEPVGEGEGGYVGGGLLAGTEGVGDVGLADVSDDALQGDGRLQQESRGERGVLVRRTEETEQAHRLQSNASERACGSYRRDGIGNGNPDWLIGRGRLLRLFLVLKMFRICKYCFVST